MKKTKVLCFIAVILVLLITLSSCSFGYFGEKNIFNQKMMSVASVDFLTDTFNKQYTNPIIEGNTTTWEIRANVGSVSEKGVKLWGYSIDKAIVEQENGVLKKVCYTTPEIKWNDHSDEAWILTAAECQIYIDRVTNHLSYGEEDYDACEPVNLFRKSIDGLLYAIKVNEKTEIKDTNEGKAFIIYPGSVAKEWEDPFKTGRPMSRYDINQAYNECSKRLMILSALDKSSAKATFMYCWDQRYISLTLYPTTLIIEFGYDTDLQIEKAEKGYTLSGV